MYIECQSKYINTSLKFVLVCSTRSCADELEAETSDYQE